MLSRNTTRWSLRNTSQCRRIASSQRLAAQAEVSQSDVNNCNISLENARPFDEIPGPSAFEFIRGVLPGGIFYKKPVTEMVKIMHSKYGPLIRMPGFFGTPDTYIDLNPDDYPVIFRNEGQWPYRRSFHSMAYYRKVYRRDFFQGVEGIIATSGEKWAKARTAVNPILMQPKNVKLYLNTMLEVNDEFLARIREIRDPITHEMPATFEDEINRLTLESVAAVALNTQLGLIRKNRDSSEAKVMLYSLRKVIDLSFKLDLIPLWKYVATPKFKELMNTLDTMTNVCRKYISEAMTRIEQCPTAKVTAEELEKEKGVLEKLLHIDEKLAVVMALDMMFAGVDTTSSTITGILFCIAKNPDKQQKLLQEVKQILPEKDSRLTVDKMRNLPYLRACIKEGMRLYPIIPGTMRRMPHDVVLSGYRVREGSDVVPASNLQLCVEKYVPRAKEFLPERWLRNEETCMRENLAGAITNPFMFLPFGFGQRSCAGRRVAEMEIEITLARLVRNFNIEFNHPLDNAFKVEFISVPNIPLKFKFEERNL